MVAGQVSIERDVAQPALAAMDAWQNASAQGLHERLAAARPRLVRLASHVGIPAHSVEDVAQETLIEAWRHVNQLRQPERFDAWLNSICMRRCLRWQRTNYADDKCRVQQPGAFAALTAVIPDPASPDLAEEVARQDMVTLVDHALGYLDPVAREAVELFYLAERSQEEIAQTLRLSVGAVKLRLHRARAQLRRIFHDALYDEAVSLGLLLDGSDGADKAGDADCWRQTSIWCSLCGRQRAEGRFERRADGGITLRLRCPGCERRGLRFVETGNLLTLDGARSFRPAYKRALREIGAFFREAVAVGRRTCPFCGGTLLFRGYGFAGGAVSVCDETAAQILPIWLECPGCCSITSSAASLVMGTSVVQRFLDAHPRMLLEPERWATYAGIDTIRICFADMVSSAKLLLFLQPDTAQVLGQYLV